MVDAAAVEDLKSAYTTLKKSLCFAPVVNVSRPVLDELVCLVAEADAEVLRFSTEERALLFRIASRDDSDDSDKLTVLMPRHDLKALLKLSAALILSKAGVGGHSVPDGAPGTLSNSQSHVVGSGHSRQSDSPNSMAHFNGSMAQWQSNRGDFDGTWCARGVPFCRIQGSFLSWFGASVDEISHEQCVIFLPFKEILLLPNFGVPSDACKGTLNSSGQLVWEDGDIWTRTDRNEGDVISMTTASTDCMARAMECMARTMVRSQFAPSSPRTSHSKIDTMRIQQKKRRVESLGPIDLVEPLGPIDLESVSNDIRKVDTCDNLRYPSLSSGNASSSSSTVAHEAALPDYSVHWMFQGDASEWVFFAAEDARALEECHKRWCESANPQDGGSQVAVSIRQRFYTIDFAKMTQTNRITGKRRKLKRQTPAQKNPEAPDQALADELEMMRLRAEDAEALLELARKNIMDLETAHAAESSLKSEACSQHQSELEIWKQRSLSEDVQLYDKPNLVLIVEEALKRFVHDSRDCSKGKAVIVSSIREIVNVRLWKQYCHHRDSVKGSLQNRSTCHWVRKEAPPTEYWCQIFPWMRFEHCANEVLLLHGTTMAVASKIAKQGFDDRLCVRGLYGRGVYLTTDFCKALQYCDKAKSKCILISRVVLGDFFIASGPMETHDRPPDVEGIGEPHDSIVAKPGTPKGKGKGKGKKQQVHWEFVVPRGYLQIYPEFLVEFQV